MANFASSFGLGHDVAIVDNLARRNADVELEAESLTPIKPLGTRLETWRELTGREIPFHRLDVAQDYRELLDLLVEWQPDAIVRASGPVARRVEIDFVGDRLAEARLAQAYVIFAPERCRVTQSEGRDGERQQPRQHGRAVDAAGQDRRDLRAGVIGPPASRADDRESDSRAA
jgi:hypothetical protein